MKSGCGMQMSLNEYIIWFILLVTKSAIATLLYNISMPHMQVILLAVNSSSIGGVKILKPCPLLK